MCHINVIGSVDYLNLNEPWPSTSYHSKMENLDGRAYFPMFYGWCFVSKCQNKQYFNKSMYELLLKGTFPIGELIYIDF